MGRKENHSSVGFEQSFRVRVHPFLHSMVRRCSADHSSEGGRGYSPSWTQDIFTDKSTEHRAS